MAECRCGKPSKYKCPKCLVSSCSLDCVKSHKIELNCTGKLDPTSFIPKQDLLTQVGLDRDYNFLQRISREIDVDIRDSKQNRVYKPRDIWRAGAKVKNMGRGMSRQVQNKSKFNKDLNCFEWTVELIVPNKPKSMIQIPDNTKIGDIFKLVDFDPEGREYVIAIRTVDGGRIILDMGSTLHLSVKGKTILEFPTLEILEKEDSDSSEDSSSDSDSDSSDSDSDSDSESSDNSDSDSNENKNETVSENIPTNSGGNDGSAMNVEPRVHVEPQELTTEVPLEMPKNELASPPTISTEAPNATATIPDNYTPQAANEPIESKNVDIEGHTDAILDN